MPHMFLCPLYICMPQGCRHHHMCPILLCASVCSQRLLHVMKGCRGPLTCWTPPLVWGVPPHVSHPLTGWLPCASTCFGDICMCYGEYSPYVGGWGMFPNMLEVLGVSAPLGVPMLHLVPPFSSLCLTYLPWLCPLLLWLWRCLLGCHLFHQ